MAEAFDYAAIVARIEGGGLDWRGTDIAAIMALLGYEVAEHKRLGKACRVVGGSHWQSLPRFDSADDAEMWIAKDCGEGPGGIEQAPYRVHAVYLGKDDK